MSDTGDTGDGLETIKDFIIAVLRDCLAYRDRFRAEIERLEAEGYTIATGGQTGDYDSSGCDFEVRIWRTGEASRSSMAAACAVGPSM